MCAVCLFCEKEAKTMEKMYTHMEVYDAAEPNCVPEKVFDISMHFH